MLEEDIESTLSDSETASSSSPPKTNWAKIGRAIGKCTALLGPIGIAIFTMSSGPFLWWVTIPVGLSVYFIEYLVFYKGNRSILELFFSSSLSKDIENHLIIRDLTDPTKNSESDKLDDQIITLEQLIAKNTIKPKIHNEKLLKKLNKAKKELARIQKLSKEKHVLSEEYAKKCSDELNEKILNYRLKLLLNKLDFKTDCELYKDNALYQKLLTIRYNTQKERRAKNGGTISTIIILAVPFGIASGITFFMYSLAMFSFISNPFLFVLGGIIALFSIIASAILMTKTVHGAVKKNVFATLFNNIKDLIKPTEEWNTLGWKKQLAYFIRGGLLLLLIFSIVVLALFATMSTCGTWIGALAAFIALFHVVSGAVAASISTCYVSISVFTILLIFNIKHCLGILHQIIQFCLHPIDTWNNFVDKLQVPKSEKKWVRILCYVVAILVALLLAATFILHCFGDGEISAEGLDAGDDSWMIYVFNRVVNFLNRFFSMKPQNASATVGTLISAGADLDFVGKHTEMIEYSMQKIRKKTGENVPDSDATSDPSSTYSSDSSENFIAPPPSPMPVPRKERPEDEDLPTNPLSISPSVFYS